MLTVFRLPRPTSTSFSLSLGILGGIAAGLFTPAGAAIPSLAEIKDIIGNRSELLINRDGRRVPVQTGSALQRNQDALITSPPNNAYTVMKFFSDQGEDLNFYIQTDPHTEPTIYHFPCSAQGNYHFGWGLAANAARGCEEGMTLIKGRPPQAALPFSVAWLKQLAQMPHRKVLYCSVAGESGLSFSTTMSGDPCIPALEKCQAAGDPTCQISTKGFWWTSHEQLKASLDCLSIPPQSVEGSGQTIEANIQALLQDVQGQDGSCRLSVYRPDDVVIFPAPDEIVTGLGDDGILVEVDDTPAGIDLNVLKGAINIRSVHNANGDFQLLKEGERYIHSGAALTPVITSDRQSRLEYIDMEVLCAFASYPANALNIPVCFEAGLLPTGNGQPVAFCNREQASGGQEGDRRTLQMSRASGEIELEYEMFMERDKLQIIYEGREIWSTNGFVSGSEQVTVPFNGSSGRVEVVLTGSLESDTTLWNYTLYCPK